MAIISEYRKLGLERVIDNRVTFGFETVFVPVPRGEKGPTLKGWPDLTRHQMEERNFHYQLEAGNIAILTGPNSGNLISIDLDGDEAAEKFRTSNAELCKQTIRTRGARGCNYWFRIRGEYPIGPSPFHDTSGKPIGELRAGRCVTVVDGIHPDGPTYAREGSRVISCGFEDIEWPSGWDLPWVPGPLEELIAKEGYPFTVGERGGVSLNEPAIVKKFTQEHLIIHDPGLGFFEYKTETGVWEPRTAVAIGDQFSRDIKALADQCDLPELLNKRTRNLLRSLTEQLAGKAEHRNAFRERPKGVIHVRNGMLHVTGETVELKKFSPEYRSLGQIGIDYNPEAECPRFLNELLRHALPESDILLLKKYAGQAILGQNLSQTFLIFEGEGGAGKGQIGSVIDRVIGHQNVAELRTSHLSGRFEMKSYVGKHLLAGRDVPGDFLNQKGASALKKLTGGDLMSIESKGKDERSEIVGEFNIIITANSRLVVAIEGDKSAWRRRLLIIRFEREPVGKPIPNFGKLLVEEEGQGILAWMVEGAQLLLRDLESDYGRIQLDAAQKKRILDLLAESDSVMAFVTRRVIPEKEGKVLTENLFDAYTDFCLEHDLPPVSKTAFQRRLRSEMLDAHKAVASENLESFGHRRRGYLGVRLLRVDEEDVEGK
ncbi:MAG: bifunctional DNA primase/polymerase [Verrucomicrobiae bacterium]|nr:bifunctional DNA primase/polymerase [Verrucomicrobiae bacterium]